MSSVNLVSQMRTRDTGLLETRYLMVNFDAICLSPMWLQNSIHNTQPVLVAQQPIFMQKLLGKQIATKLTLQRGEFIR